MTTIDPNHARPARTVLEQHIRDRRMTIEEFASYVEEFAREHGEPGMIGVRHLQRLVAGKRGDGRPLGPMKPATVRLIERVTGERIGVLLSASPVQYVSDDGHTELHLRLDTARRVDRHTVYLMRRAVQKIRLTDRQFGASAARDDVRFMLQKTEALFRHCLTIGTYAPLAQLLAELHTLAGWQALDRADLNTAWSEYNLARLAASVSGSPAHIAHATGEQAYVLIDASRLRDASELLHAHATNVQSAPLPLQAWMSAVLGEVHAASGDRSNSLRAFDKAADLLAQGQANPCQSVTLDSIHMTRWRGQALAKLGQPEAIDTLTYSLRTLDSTFVRARAALHIDLACALFAKGARSAARQHANHASELVIKLGSVRQLRRLQALSKGTHDLADRLYTGRKFTPSR